MSQIETTLAYPYLLRRYISVLIDQIFIITLLGILSSILSKIGFFPDQLKMAFVAIFFLYEPICISTTCTVGQYLTKIRVRKHENTEKKLNFPMAVIRFFTKIFLGIFSFFTVSTNDQKRAIHDIASQSVVIDISS